MYRQVHGSFWTDPKVRKMDTDCKLLFLYLITNPHTHSSGLYYLPRVLVEQETGLSSKRVQDALDALSLSGVIEWDDLSQVVWVKGMLKHQSHNGKILKAVAKHLVMELHCLDIVTRFLKKYPNVLTSMDDLSRVDFEQRIAHLDKKTESDEPLLSYTDTDTDTDTDTRLIRDESTAPASGESAPHHRRKQLPLLKDPEALEKVLTAIDLEKFRKEFHSQGLDVDRYFAQNFRPYVLTGDAKNPKPNPAKWRDLDKAFRESCERAISKGMFQLPPNNYRPIEGASTTEDFDDKYFPKPKQDAAQES